MFSVTISAATKSEMYTNLKNVTNLFSEPVDASPTAATTLTKAVTRAKKAKAVEAEDEFEIDEDDARIEEELAQAEQDESEEAEVETPKFTIENVRSAFQTYSKAKTGNREKALAILAKYKVKNINGLKTTDYPAVMKALGA